MPRRLRDQRLRWTSEDGSLCHARMNARQRRKGVALCAPCARRTWCEPATAWRVAGSIAVALGVLTVGTTGAGFVRLEDFESLATGPIQGQNG